mgnify:CR=1 FL=1
MIKDFDLERELEFKVWHRGQGHMYDNVAVSDENTVGYESTSNNFNCETSKEIVVLQYTSRLDKEGEKIFEGDVLKMSRVADPVIVKWDEEKVGFVLENPEETAISKKQVDWPSSEKSLKILGNIYENPEIFEGEREED